MKKLYFVLTIILMSSISAFSQTEIKADQKEQALSINYEKDSEGIFYVIMFVDENLIEESKKEIKNINAENALPSIRIARLNIDDSKTGLTPCLVVRRFNHQASAKSFVELINKNSLLSKHKPVLISQNNYRIFLKKQDLEAYKQFLKS